MHRSPAWQFTQPAVAWILVYLALRSGFHLRAESTACLLAARALQGFATGTATAVLSATLLDTDRVRGPMLNSLAPMLGMASGGLGSGLLVEFAPWPTQLIYYALLGLMVLQALYVWRLPETVSRIPGALQSLAPTLHVPPQARRALWLAMPLNVAVWALGGFFSSLAPSLVRVATGSTSHLIGGGLVAVVTFAGMGVLLIRHAGRSIVADSRLTRPGALAGFMAGLAAILGNPKAILFYMGVLPGFFDLGRVTPADIAVIALLSAIVPFVGNMGLALFLGRVRRLMTSPTALRRTNQAAGALLIVVAVVIAVT